MIEVEIRGKLNKEQSEKMKETLAREGKFVKHTDREMFLLYDYPGYDHDPTKRLVDIRLRNTNGECEIMMKEKISTHNEARKETSLKLKDGDLERAKAIAKGFGFTKALKMQRSTDVYEYDDIEWSLVRTPKDYRYYEAEMTAMNESEVPEIHARLVQKAKSLELEVLGPEEMKGFIAFLDKEVNEEIVL